MTSFSSGSQARPTSRQGITCAGRVLGEALLVDREYEHGDGTGALKFPCSVQYLQPSTWFI